MSRYGVFIIESLEAEEFFDGEYLEEILKLQNIEVYYHWVSCKTELEKALLDFENTDIRYLYFSCHANSKGIKLSNAFISNKIFNEMLKDKLYNKRVFFSACSTGNRDLASIIIKNGAYSLIAPPYKIQFEKAALFWASFFLLVAEIDSYKLKRKTIKPKIIQCAYFFKVPINYYSYIRNDRDNKMRCLKIHPQKRNINTITKINKSA